MKRSLISLMLITAIIISTGLAYAIGGGTGWGSGDWTTTSGIIDGLSGGTITVDQTYNNNWARAVHPVTTASSGKFTATFQFKVMNLSSDVFVGVSNSIADSGDLLVGYSKDNNAFIVTQNQQNVLANLGSSVNPGSTYTATISSNDGKTFTVGISGAGSTSVSGFVPTYVALQINNNGAASGPQVTSVNYDSAAGTASVTPTPSPSPGTNSTNSTSAGIDHSAMQNWYANYYEPPVLSNQSLIFDQGGKVVSVVTGKPGQATIMPAAGATIVPNLAPTTTPSVTIVAPTATVTATTPTAPPVVTAAPTKSQSPGFGIILAAIGMLAAIFLVSRKK